MILELKIRNFLSFKNEVTFSFEASSDTTLEEYYVAEPVAGIRLLKMAMIYGANASGKSNLLNAFTFVKRFIRNIPKERDNITHFTPFIFDNTERMPGAFELTFFAYGIKYKYLFELDSEKVIKEILYFYPGTQPAIVFSRHFDEVKQISIIDFGPKLKISDQAKETIQLKTLKNMSVFAAISQINLAIPELDRPADELRNRFFTVIDPYTTLTKYSDLFIKSDERIKKLALGFIKEADFNISNVSFEFEKTTFEHRIVRDGKEELHNLPEAFESKGTMRYYGLSAPFFNTIEKNAFLPIDEIDSALHPLLVMHFLREFLKRSKQSQLLFTTHNLSLLQEKDFLRKDVIWFTEKGEDGATSLYSLSDFNFRKELSFYNAYKQGKFGAIPNLEE